MTEQPDSKPKPTPKSGGVKLKLNGSKTYALGIGLIAYLAIQAITGQTVDDNIVTGILAGMGLTLRHGIAKAGKG